jgi:hypothetical protein
LVNDTRRRLRRYFAAGTPQPSTTVAANCAASANDVCRKNAAGANDWHRKKCRNRQRLMPHEMREVSLILDGTLYV